MPRGQLGKRPVSGSRSLDTREKVGAQRAFYPILLSPALSPVFTVLQQAIGKSKLGWARGVVSCDNSKAEKAACVGV